MGMDDAVRRLGFKDNAEMVAMVNQVDLTNMRAFHVFLIWKEVDGSKAGLESILNRWPPAQKVD